MHRNLMRMFRLYMLIGGMPQAVEAYLEHNNPKGDKINPIEVKSGNYRGHKSLDMFCDKYSSRIRDKYVVHTKDYKWENGIHYLPVYMIPFLLKSLPFMLKKAQIMQFFSIKKILC